MRIDGALNEEQLAAAIDTEGAVLVTAGAGSGKTRLLTHRIVHLISDCGVKPYCILAVTFTNKAAAEMKNRLIAMESMAESVWVSTFHSMCVRILRRDIDKLGRYNKNFTIYADDDSERAVKRIIKEGNYEGESLHKKCLYAISEAKNQGLSPEEYGKEFSYKSDIDMLVDVYTKYEDELKKSNSLDFDDLLTKAYDLLKASPETREYYQNRFKYIHVDEFQDTNVIQYNLIKLLAGSNGNIFVVGDEDQSIYGWRGADVTNMRNFIDEYHAKIYKLERNYRSTKSILDAANSLIKNNKSRIEKKLWTDAGEGDAVVVYKSESDTFEADYVVNTISKMLRGGYKPSDFAVLMRVNAMTRVLEQRLMQYNIAYKVYGGFKFFDRKEVKDILAYLKVLANPADNESLLRIINFPKRGIGDGAQAQLVAYGEVEGKRLCEVILDIGNNQDLPNGLIKKVKPFADVLRDLFDVAGKTASVYELAEYVVGRIDLKGVYAEDTEENISRRLNINDFLAGVKDFSDRRGGDLSQYLEEVTLYTEDDEAGGEAVYLSTIHSAKGMEFRIVFIVGMEEGLFPISRARDDENELEEERRLMYVAITRAKEKLYLTFCSSRYMYGERKLQMPSRFFGEIDETLGNKLSPPPQINFSPAYSSSAARPGVQSTAPLVQNIAKSQKHVINDYPVGTRVKHKRFGEGVVETIADIGGNSYLTIDFESCGKMTLSLQFAPIQKVE